jgi:hypothetical protein
VSGIAAVVMTAAAAVAAGQAEPRGQVTFTKDIAPILQRSCQNCHHPGAMAPMSLITYEDVRPWARAIKLKTSLREMPPWFIEKNVGIQKFKDDPSLSNEEIAAIATWADGGTPRGNPVDMPPPRLFADGTAWSIGTPDLIVSSPATIVKAVAADDNRQLEPSPTRLTEDRYVKAVEVKEIRLAEKTITRVAGRTAGDLNYFALHHASIAAEAPEEVERDRGGFGITWELGQNATIFPDDVGVRIAAGSLLTWDVHVHSVGKEVPIRIDVAFKFHPKGYRPKHTQSSVQMTLASQSDLDIPADQDNVMVDGFYVIPQPTRMLTFEPHLHASGKRMCVEAIYPNGYREILNCAGYNHNWVKIYNYEDDVAPLLPTGTIIHMISWHDNTPGNRRVVDPRNWKGFGTRSIDDMSTMLPRMIYLTEEEFKAEVAARKAKQGLGNTTTAQHNND